jgi:hypothetical protein
MRNFPETNNFRSVLTKKLFSSFWGAILIAMSEISYIKQCTDRNYVHKHVYLGLRTPCGS